MNAGEMLEGVK